MVVMLLILLTKQSTDPPVIDGNSRETYAIFPSFYALGRAHKILLFIYKKRGL